MKTKILGILIATLLIATTVLPVIGTVNISDYKVSVMSREEDQHQGENILSDKLATPISLNNIPTPKAMEGKRSSLIIKHVPRPLNVPIATTPDDE